MVPRTTLARGHRLVERANAKKWYCVATRSSLSVTLARDSRWLPRCCSKSNHAVKREGFKCATLRVTGDALGPVTSTTRSASKGPGCPRSRFGLVYPRGYPELKNAVRSAKSCHVFCHRPSCRNWLKQLSDRRFGVSCSFHWPYCSSQRKRRSDRRFGFSSSFHLRRGTKRMKSATKSAIPLISFGLLIGTTGRWPGSRQPDG
jgi:hypothetical protein